MSERLHRYEWNGHCLLQDQRGEWVKFAEAEAALQSEQGMARLLRSTLDDQRKIILSLDGAVAENTKLRAAIQSWEDSAQQGHPSPCTLGPLCPYCEIERLRAELAEAQADRMRGNCKIMADDCDCGLCKREREIERLQGQVADMSLVIERLRQFTDRFPTTQDGHPVAGGDTVYCKLGGVIEAVTLPHPPRHGVYTGCFHTYEAAVAATAAGGGE